MILLPKPPKLLGLWTCTFSSGIYVQTYFTVSGDNPASPSRESTRIFFKKMHSNLREKTELKCVAIGNVPQGSILYNIVN